jgi:hypothetical protein
MLQLAYVGNINQSICSVLDLTRNFVAIVLGFEDSFYGPSDSFGDDFHSSVKVT